MSAAATTTPTRYIDGDDAMDVDDASIAIRSKMRTSNSNFKHGMVLFKRGTSTVDITSTNFVARGSATASPTVVVVTDPDAMRESFDQFILAALHKHPGAQYMLGLFYDNGFGGVVANTDTAFAYYLDAANQKHAKAQFRVGCWYQDYDNNDIEALKWYKLASQYGQHAVAQYNAGYFHEHGKGGVSRDMQMALLWYKASATNNNAFSQFRIGELYSSSNGGTYVDGGGGNRFVEAMKYYRRAANQNHATAQFAVGKLYENGLGIVGGGGGGGGENPAEAFLWYKRSTENRIANPAAEYKIGNFYEHDKGGVGQDLAVALMWYTKSANHGYNKAQYKVGYFFEHGKGMASEDLATAIAWYKKVAVNVVNDSSTIAKAQFRLATFYEGNNTKSDDEAAIKWYRSAAERGHAEAQFTMGRYLSSGGPLGLSKDEAQSTMWLEMAAKKRHGKSQYILGMQCEVAGDLDGAFKWYALSTEGGNDDAQCRLGIMYWNGWGTPKNQSKAIHYMTKSAENGNALAQNNMGGFYEYGTNAGVTNDIAADPFGAYEYYEKSAKQGNGGGLFNLGRIYEYGMVVSGGVTKNLKKAFELYIKSSEAGDADGRFALGRFYEKGMGGVAKNPAMTAQCYLDWAMNDQQKIYKRVSE